VPVGSAAGSEAVGSAATVAAEGGSFDEPFAAAFAAFASVFAAFASAFVDVEVPAVDEEPAEDFEVVCPTALPLDFEEPFPPAVEARGGEEATGVVGAPAAGAGAGLGPVATGAGGVAPAGRGCGDPWLLGWFATEPGSAGVAATWREPATCEPWLPPPAPAPPAGPPGTAWSAGATDTVGAIELPEDAATDASPIACWPLGAAGIGSGGRY
jgi:hypothetical protein